MMDIPELDKYIASYIQGGFGPADMAVMKEEVEKLKPDEIYLEIGVDEGRSLTVARYYAHPDVWTIGVDYIDPAARGPYMNIPLGWNPQGQAMIKHGTRCIFIHGDSQDVAKIWTKPISLLFIDGDHSYEGVKKDTLSWEPLVKKGGTIIFHDIDYKDGVPVWLDDHYGKGKWENCHGKIGRVRK